MTQTTINIGLTGMARAGKDTVAKILINHWGYTRISVADPLKFGIDAALGCFGATPADETKDDLIPELGVTPRQIWKDFSEEFLKPKFGRDIMAKIMAKRAQQMEGPLIVTDVRFNEEAELLYSQGFKIIKVVRPGQIRREQDNHVSENGIDERFVFATLYNYDEPDELKRSLTLDDSLTKLLYPGMRPTFQEILGEDYLTDYKADGHNVTFPCK
jgi:hypothetical protein